ncbi:hypothetical protein [Cytophaga hutchinsonii]|uniref:hypothetical protein n=1 Tax=Cytophaga hutchinsonii TaxID=985 RepID=UPI0034E94E29
MDFTKYVTGSTIPHIYYKDYANETIELPCFEEQLKISNILFLINNKIELEIKGLHQMEKQKKYLLANLFI